jgi:hypothetical protein
MSAATIKFGDKILEITDPRNVQPVSADLYTEIRDYHGILCLSFACLITDGDAEPRAEITSRIRLNLAGVVDLRNAIDGALKRVMPGKETAN